MSPYFLTPHSFAVETDGYAVILDLKCDKYIAVAPEGLGALRTSVQGWRPVSDRSFNPPNSPKEKIELDIENRAIQNLGLLDSLVAGGILTENVLLGKDASPVCVERATSTVWPSEHPPRSAGIRYLPSFLFAKGLSNFTLKTWSISATLGHIRQGHEQLAVHVPDLNIGRARQLVAAFAALNGVPHEADGECLRNSLSLSKFLSRYSIFPRCVLGVRMQPFSAHAWLQQGQIAFTDTVAHVNSFTPIASF